MPPAILSLCFDNCLSETLRWGKTATLLYPEYPIRPEIVQIPFISLQSVAGLIGQNPAQIAGICIIWVYLKRVGAGGGSRTHTALQPTDFESLSYVYKCCALC